MSEVVVGRVEPGFEAVAEAFDRNVREGLEVGAGVCVHVHGRKVAELWGGTFDAGGTQPYDDRTLQLVFSTTKGLTAILAGILVDRGQLDPGAPVAEYWPELTAAAKSGITVSQLFSHQAGLVTVEPPLAFDAALDWTTVCEALAVQQPLWEPGTTHGYHALTYGWLAGEVLRRVTGKDVGELLQAEVSEPLGVDAWIGLPEAEEARVSPIIPWPPPPPELAAMVEEMMGPESIGGRAMTMSGTFPVDEENTVWNQRAVHAAEIPAANAITNATALSRIYAATIGEVDGVLLFSPATMERVRREQVRGPDACILMETSFGLGFMLASAFNPMTGPGSFGHPGAGGSLAFAHPESGIAFGYVMNRMDMNLAGDQRVARLLQAVLESV